MREDRDIREDKDGLVTERDIRIQRTKRSGLKEHKEVEEEQRGQKENGGSETRAQKRWRRWWR